MNYYNEFDAFSVMWLKELIAAGHLPEGKVDDRSILDVKASDLKGFDQCHFFAGIGGWSLALEMAKWPTNRQVWTGSCPCQPFSVAGRQNGSSDERHLWPTWYELIAKCRPPTVFGEQVASAISHNWLDAVSTDLESCDYAVGAVVFPAAGAGAPHIRDRLYWVGHTEHGRSVSSEAYQRSSSRHTSPVGQRQASGTVANPTSKRLEGPARARIRGKGARPGVDGYVASIRPDYWKTTHWAECTDGGRRPFERGAFPVSYGISKGVGRVCGDSNSKRLHGYGNAIVPPQAALFIEASDGAY